MIEYSGPVAEAILLFVLAYKDRWRTFPAFSLMIATDLLFTATSNVAYDEGWRVVFGRLYVASQVVSLLLQIAVLLELARRVLKPTGAWSSGVKKPFYTIVCAGALLALTSSLFVSPGNIHGFRLFQLRSDIFTELLTCEIVIAMMLSANQVGLAWRNHVIAIGQGLIAWALLTALTDGLGVYLKSQNSFSPVFYYVRSFVYLGTVLYWTVALWHEEPARKPISPALRKYIVALNDRVQYDLEKAGH